MPYAVTSACIRCKYMDCVEVCPVDCFYEGENMLVIHPDECIDCGVCEPECPAGPALAEHHAEERAAGRCRRLEGNTGQDRPAFRTSGNVILGVLHPIIC